MFLDNINETQNRYYYKASSRRKQNIFNKITVHSEKYQFSVLSEYVYNCRELKMIYFYIIKISGEPTTEVFA